MCAGTVTQKEANLKCDSFVCRMKNRKKIYPEEEEISSESIESSVVNKKKSQTQKWPEKQVTKSEQ